MHVVHGGRRRTAGLVAVVSIVSAMLVGVTAPAQAAANALNFDPGFIISDAIFFDGTTMSASDIQVFLNLKGAACKAAADGTPCLKDYAQDTSAGRPASAGCPAGYTGSSSESAATIIAKVARSCGVNPQVLLVTLQKEEGLVTTSTPSAARYRTAMGYGCPDTAPCNTLYYGFFNQVFLAAQQFRNYALYPTYYGFRAGVTRTIAYSPNAACGSSSVYIQNQATAGLYDYTPYQPNAAALAAGYGTGDSCSSYGNRNFYLYFTDWFGPTTQRAPIGVVDAVTTTLQAVTATGWALDPDTHDPIVVHLYVDGRDVAAGYTTVSRPDVAAIYQKGDLHGYRLSAPVAPGLHRVCVYAVDPAGTSAPELGCQSVNIPNLPPIGVVDTLTASAGLVTASGWAFDPNSAAPIVVHLYVDGRDAAATVATGWRPDVAAVYGTSAPSGYTLTAGTTSGVHQVCVYAVDPTGAYAPQLGCRTVSTVNRAPVGVIDSASVSGGLLTVTGWAFDPDTTGPIWVHFYVDGTWTGATLASSSRPDVGAVYGDGDSHGYAATMPTAPGTHRVCAFGIDAAGGVNPQLACTTYTAPDPGALAIGVVDRTGVTATTATAVGWALDPDTNASIEVRAYVDGKRVASVTADQTRTDVGAVYGKGDQHGYTLAYPVPTGTHTACLRAVDANAGVETEIGCTTLTVPTDAVDRPPVGVIDFATPANGQVTVIGWAFDPDTYASIGIRLRIDGTVSATTVAANYRPDVAAVYGNGSAHGYTVTMPTTTGTHTVCLDGIEPGGTPVIQLACADYTAS